MIYWFTSDCHFGHEKIIGYTNRPFKNVDHMNEMLIKNWNSRVKEEDVVFHIGDFCYKRSQVSYKKFADRLNGKIIFIKGNHDDTNDVNTPIIDITIRHGGKTILLIHRPEDSSPFYTDLVLCGHVHNAWKFKEMDFNGEYKWDCVNVGVDVWNYHPINITEILGEYSNWKTNGDKNA